MSTKGRITMAQVYEDVADMLTGDDSPTHCTIRCYVNDTLDRYEKDGFTVFHGYNQDKAYREVRRLMGLSTAIPRYGSR